MVRVVWDDPQTPSKDLRGHLAADGVAVHGCAGEAFSARTPQTGWPEVRRTACGVFFFFCLLRMEAKERSIPRKTPAAHRDI